MNEQVQQQTEVAKSQNQEALQSSVTGVMVQYMTEQAQSLGVKISASLQMTTDEEGLLSVKSAQVTCYEGTEEAIAAVQGMLETECGISREKQEWTYKS